MLGNIVNGLNNKYLVAAVVLFVLVLPFIRKVI